MSLSILEMVRQEIGGDAVGHLSRQIGADEDTTQQAISGALPMLVTALANNSSDSGGASSLLGALDRDHDGSILDDVAGFLGQGDTDTGQGILKHVLGGRKETVANGLSRMSGLDKGAAMQLLAMLAPVVMGALGRARRQKNLGGADLSSILQQDRRRVEREAPEGMGVLTQLLDADHDGDVTDDVARLGMSMLGKFLGGRR